MQVKVIQSGLWQNDGLKTCGKQENLKITKKYLQKKDYDKCSPCRRQHVMNNRRILKIRTIKNIDKDKFGGEIFAIYFWTLLYVKYIYTVNQILLNREKTSYL